jgi:predicted nucleic acid-binding protein
MAGGADLIVTGDRAMLDLVRYRDIQIVTLADYLGFP